MKRYSKSLGGNNRKTDSQQKLVREGAKTDAPVNSKGLARYKTGQRFSKRSAY